MYSLKLIALTIVLAASGFAQTDSKASSPAPNSGIAPSSGAPVYKVCGKKNPPPCASVPPKPTYQANPNYTNAARRQRFEGTALYEVVVNSDGRVLSIKQKGMILGYGLDEEGIRALKQWKFKPGMMNGTPVPVQIEVELEFRFSMS